MKEIKVKMVSEYYGHSINANGSVNLTLKAKYDQLVNSVQLIQMLNENITIKARVHDQTYNLGTMMLKQLVIDGDGESKIKLNSICDYVNISSINELILSDESVKSFKVVFSCKIENESEE